MKLCENCLEIYDDLEHNIYCPKRWCQSELAEIDDLLIDITRKFWSMGWITMCCCSGHLYDEYFLPHITFCAHQFDDDNLREISEANLRELKKAHKRFVLLKEEGIIVDEIMKFRDGYFFKVRADLDPHKDQFCPQERLKVQFNFLNFLYKIIDEFEKASCGKRKKSARKEEQSLLQI
jgi:hypothetical protein